MKMQAHAWYATHCFPAATACACFDSALSCCRLRRNCGFAFTSNLTPGAASLTHFLHFSPLNSQFIFTVGLSDPPPFLVEIWYFCAIDFSLSTAILLLAQMIPFVAIGLWATLTTAIPTIQTKGNKFFTSDGAQFFVKGVKSDHYRKCSN